MTEERVERKLAAILVADVAGYSRLMGEDETGTRARFNDQLDKVVRPIIHEHRGRLVKTMGDGFLVEFGSVLDAVQCAADIQSAVGELQGDEPDDHKMLFRIGIHLGDVIVEGEDIHGHGVNIAARLEGLAEPGGICVSDMVHAGVRNKLALEFADLGEQSLKNIAEPVHAFNVILADASGSGAAPSDALFRRPAVAVLPFENISNDPEQEYFADGLTEDIITALSLWRSFPVIARNSTFAYKGQSPDIRTVGEELGARYVIEGSVRRTTERVRVTAQLINSETGHHVWAERYDRHIGDIFALQDEIAHRVAATVEPELEREEQKRSFASQPANLDAWGFYQRGMSHHHEYTKEGNQRARDMCERAVELDANFAPAYIGLAYSYYQDVRSDYVASHEDAVAELFKAVRRAIELDDLDARSHWILGLGYQISSQYDSAISEGKKAVELNPNFAYAHFALGGSYFFGGHPQEAIACLHKALELNPRDRRNFIVLKVLAHCYLNARLYEDAIDCARKSIAIRSDYVETHLVLVSSLGHAGRSAEARKVVDECERLRPGSVKDGQGLLAFIDIVANFDAELLQNEHFLDGLRKAGWEG